MEQPLGIEIDNRVCLLKKSLYGLKQAPNKKISEFFVGYGLVQSESNPCLYHMRNDKFRLFVILYVDDGIIIFVAIASLRLIIC